MNDGVETALVIGTTPDMGRAIARAGWRSASEPAGRHAIRTGQGAALLIASGAGMA